MRTLALALVLAGLARAQDLGRAKQLLGESKEAEVREGTNLCAQADSAEAADLLLDVLRLTRPRSLSAEHYRDIAWEGLVRLKSAEARARIDREAHASRDARVRQWCAELLGIYGDPAFGPTLVKALGDKESDVRRWAARSLGLLRHADAAPALLPLARDADPFVRANAIEALAWIDPAKHGKALVEALSSDRDGGVRCALLGAVPGLLRDEARALSARALDDADWRPRMQAVDNLAGVRTKESVDALVRATGDGRPVVAWRAIKALQRMTGKEVADAASWSGWWKAHREAFEFPAEEGEAREGEEERRTIAYGIPLVSDHVAFIVDKSARMQDMLKSQSARKDTAALDELERVLTELRGRLVFNVYVYREDVKAFRKEPAALDEKEQKKALRFVAAEKNKGAKDIWQVLETVVSDPDVDTAFLLSSGEPDVGLYVHWNRVTSNLRDLNRFHKVTVHTVVYSDSKWYRDQLEKIAEATGGRFQWFE